MRTKYFFFLVILFIYTTSFAFNSGLGVMTENALQGFAKIKNKTLYFGHQSVGYNIVDGIADILEMEGIGDYRIVDISGNPALLHGPGFFHSTIGKNGDPFLKIDKFKDFIDNHHNDLDIAFFKFCYVDITKNLNIDRLFSHYKKIMDGLVKKYPDVSFVYFTAPLRTVQTGPKAWVKKLFNKPLGGAIDNVQRDTLNRKIISEYSATGHVFDLAKAESTFSDGRINQFEYQGNPYNFLIPEYTGDGKHLNVRGRRIIARDLLSFFGSQAF